jgi:hypothetical protein
MDGDGQNDPADNLLLLEKIQQGMMLCLMLAEKDSFSKNSFREQASCENIYVCIHDSVAPQGQGERLI